MEQEYIKEAVDSHLRGCYFAEAASIYVSFPISQAQTSWHDHLHSVPIKGTTDTFFAPSSSQLNSIDDIEPLLTRVHEIEHYRTLVSTPFGLFLFRILQAAAFCTQYVSITISKHLGSTYSINEPLLNWYRHKGHTLVDANAKENDGRSLREWLDFLLVEGAAIRNCTTELLQSSGSNATETCDILNLLLMAVKRIHGFDFVPEISPRTPIAIGSGNLTVLSLIEARSRLVELAYLVQLGASEQQISQWKQTRIWGVYAPVFDYAMRRLNNKVPLALLTLDIALLGAIDPTLMTEGALYLEDIHPVLRLYRILDVVENVEIDLSNIQQVHDITNMIYSENGWPSVKTLARRIKSRTFMREDIHETFREEMSTETSALLPSDIVERNIFKQCKRALNIRADNPLALALQWSTSSTFNPHIFHPIVEYYKDKVRIPIPELETDLIQHDLSVYILYRHLMVSLLCSFFFGGDSHSLELARCLSNVYTKWAQSEIREKQLEVPKGMYFKLEEIAENDIGINMD